MCCTEETMCSTHTIFNSLMRTNQLPTAPPICSGTDADQGTCGCGSTLETDRPHFSHENVNHGPRCKGTQPLDDMPVWQGGTPGAARKGKAPGGWPMLSAGQPSMSSRLCAGQDARNEASGRRHLLHSRHVMRLCSGSVGSMCLEANTWHTSFPPVGSQATRSTSLLHSTQSDVP